MDKTAKQRLASYRALRLEVDNQLDRLARLRNEEQLPAMRESSGAKSTGGNGDRMERAILRRMEYEERITPQIEAAKREMAAIEAAIDPCGGSTGEGVPEAEIHRRGWVQADTVGRRGHYDLWGR